MLYFAYGSNLNWRQMTKERCPGSKFLKSHNLKGYKLCFSHKTNHSIYGHANIIKSKKSTVPGALWKITKKNEKKLDLYEDFPTLYKKLYFTYNNKKVMTYYMVRKSSFMYPKELYLNTIKQGYKDCKLDTNYLKKALKN